MLNIHNLGVFNTIQHYSMQAILILGFCNYYIYWLDKLLVYKLMIDWVEWVIITILK